MNINISNLTEFDWLRIRASLLCSTQELSEVESDQEEQYYETYLKVKNAMAGQLSDR